MSLKWGSLRTRVQNSENSFTLALSAPSLPSEFKIEDAQMERHFTLEYWMDDEWYVGKLKEVPGVFSQGETLDELETNIRDAYHLMVAL